MNIDDTAQIITSSRAFAKLAETWFGKPANEIVKRFLFVKRGISITTGVLLTFIALCIGTSWENPLHYGPIFIMLLFISIFTWCGLNVFQSFVFDKFESRFKKLLKTLFIDMKDKDEVKQLQDFNFLKSKAEEACERWYHHYQGECRTCGIFSKEAENAGKRFRKNYNFLRKFGLVDLELRAYMHNISLTPSFIA